MISGRRVARLMALAALALPAAAQSPAFTASPVDTVVTDGEALMLRAVISPPQTSCAWLRDGEVAAADAPFSVTLNEAKTETHSGIWHCAVAHGQDTILSYGAEVQVLPRHPWPGSLRALQPLPEATLVRALAGDGAGRVYAAGIVNGAERIVRLLTDGSTDASFPSITADGEVRALLASGDRLWIGGRFTTLNGSPALRLAWRSANGVLTAVPADAGVNALAAHTGGAVLAAGEFTQIAGQTRHRLARLRQDATLDPAFNAGDGTAFHLPGQWLTALAVNSDGAIYAGGSFSIPSSPQARQRLVRLRSGGTVDSGFAPFAPFDREVRALALLPDGSVIAGGDFTKPQAGLARVKADGTVDAAFIPFLTVAAPASVSVRALHVPAVPAGRILAAGRFSTVSGLPRHGMALVQSQNGQADSSLLPPSFRRTVTNVRVPATVMVVLPQSSGFIAGSDADTSVPAFAALHNGTPAEQPSVYSLPRARTVTAGGPLLLRAGVRGWPRPSFQWMRNGAPAGPAGEWLAIPAAQAVNAGEYSVVATNASGSLQSQSVRVTVVPPEYRGEQPQGFAWTGRDASIPEQGGGLRAEIAVPGNFIAGRIRVHLTLRHEALDHLRLTLLPPAALALPPVPLLRTGDGSRGRDLDGVTFVADAPPFSASPWPHTGAWQPDDAAALRNLATLPANGTWTLVVEDTSAFDGFTGTLTAWMLEFRRPAPVPSWSSWQTWRGLVSVPGGDVDSNGRNDLTDYMLAADTRGPLPDLAHGRFLTIHRRWIDGGLVHRYEVSTDLQRWDAFVPPAGGVIRYPDGTELLTLQPPPGYRFLRALASPLTGQFGRR